MSIDSELQKHSALLLGVGSPGEVKNVELKLGEKKVEIELGWQWGAAATCPVCGRECSIHECAPERTWRHLDTMQFTTLIRARTPRSECPEHGVKTMLVPWAAPQGRFTLLFERFAVEVLLASGSISQACGLLGLSWDTAQEIMRRAVEQGLERRQLEELKHLGMDEKSFKRGQSYITLLTDLEESRVLDVVEERTAQAADQLWETLSPEQKQTVEAVAVDMWEPFIQTIQKQVPDADIVHDKFHVSKYLGEAVDQVRRAKQTLTNFATWLNFYPQWRTSRQSRSSKPRRRCSKRWRIRDVCSCWMSCRGASGAFANWLPWSGQRCPPCRGTFRNCGTPASWKTRSGALRCSTGW
jgi:transposase